VLPQGKGVNSNSAKIEAGYEHTALRRLPRENRVQILLEVGGEFQAALFVDTSRVDPQRRGYYGRRPGFSFHFSPSVTTLKHFWPP
jgi:hypothetical protein